MSTAITKSNGGALAVSGSVQINGVADVFRLAHELAKAGGFVPRAFLGKPEAIAACVLMGVELGIGPMEALRSIHVIDGKPTMSADMMLGRAIRAGVRHQWVRSDASVAHLRLTRDGFAAHEHSYTIDEAKAAGLASKDNWRKYPAAMLRARCVSAALRAFAPDVLGSGIYTPEELDGDDHVPAVALVEPRATPAAESIEEALIVAEASCAAPRRERLTDCADDVQLAAWIRANADALRKRGAAAIGKVIEHADRIGIGDATAWVDACMTTEAA